MERFKKKPTHSSGQSFLYQTTFGRIILSLIIRPWFTKLGGAFLNSRLSKLGIKKFVKKNKINKDDYILDDIKSYNDFFKRKIKPKLRPINNETHSLISPCDAYLTCYNIGEEAIFEVKNSYYRLKDLINDEEEAKEFIGGKILIFRLQVDNYHRYCFPLDGKKIKEYHIKGVFHTVNPIALESYNFYKTNSRTVSIYETNYGKVLMTEVGAMMVGKIKNHDIKEFKKGEEKGYFEFGGSTIVLAVKNAVIDEEFFKNTADGYETLVLYGEKIGVMQ
jgi:phosphatidylserine decarboxylase